MTLAFCLDYSRLLKKFTLVPPILRSLYSYMFWAFIACSISKLSR